MNIRLMLVLGFVVGSAWMSRDTIATGFSLLTGRYDVVHTAQPSTTTTTDTDPDSLTVWERESNRRIYLWRDCTYTDYYEENTDECDRLHESVNR